MTIFKRTCTAGAVLLTLASGAFANPSAAEPVRRIHVANDGLDADDCGTRRAPCRTIGRAQALAVAGDTILVGPGIYGDVNRDGSASGDAEERPVQGASLRLDKPVKLLS